MSGILFNVTPAWNFLKHCSTTQHTAVDASAGNGRLQEEVKKLRLQIQQRDNEINILVSMLKKRGGMTGSIPHQASTPTLNASNLPGDIQNFGFVVLAVASLAERILSAELSIYLCPIKFLCRVYLLPYVSLLYISQLVLCAMLVKRNVSQLLFINRCVISWKISLLFNVLIFRVFPSLTHCTDMLWDCISAASKNCGLGILSDHQI